MAKVQKIGRVTFRHLTNEEALKEFGTSFVIVGSRPASLEHAKPPAGLTDGGCFVRGASTGELVRLFSFMPSQGLQCAIVTFLVPFQFLKNQPFDD